MIEIRGKVIHGDHFGKKLGFPTANLDRRDYIKRRLKIKFGVYAGWVEVALKNYKAGIVIGPTDNNHLPKIEACLIGFKGNLYGKKIIISLQKYLRPFKKFKNEEELKKQIRTDIEKVKQLTMNL